MIKLQHLLKQRQQANSVRIALKKITEAGIKCVVSQATVIFNRQQNDTYVIRDPKLLKNKKYLDYHGRYGLKFPSKFRFVFMEELNLGAIYSMQNDWLVVWQNPGHNFDF